MSEICTEIAIDLTRDCVNTPVAGIRQTAILIPLDHITAKTVTDGLMTVLTLSAAGHKIEVMKEFMNYQNSFVNPADGQSGFKHSVQNIHVLDPSVEVRNAINLMATSGRRFALVLERNWKGTDSADAFLVFGVNFGLEIPDGGIVDNSNENDGAMIISLGTPEVFKEQRVPDVLLLTDYAATKTAFDNAFAPA